MHRRFLSSAVVCIGGYVSVAALSVMGAHILLVVHPQSAFAEQLVAPVARGLEFLDAHWKSVLILVAPFIAPVARDMVPRVRKIWGVEFDPVQLEPEGVHDKPVPEGESKVS